MELTEIRQQQQQKAKQMRDGMKGLQNEQQEQIQNRGREALAQQVSGVRKDYGTRGLLYSGLRRGAEAGAAQNIASQGAGQMAQANLGLQNQLQGAEDAAIQTGLQEQSIAQQEADKNYERALEERKQGQGVGGILSGAFKRMF